MDESMDRAGSEAYYAFKVGRFNCLAISDGYHNYQLDQFFANVPAESLETALTPGDLASQTILSPFTCLYVSNGRNHVMVDAGAGGKVAPTAGRLGQNMSAAGIAVADIDTVIITHCHPDHIGGLLDSGGRPIFPGAQHYIFQSEYEFWLSDDAYKHAPVAWVQLARRQLFVLKNRLRLVDVETEIHAGIKALAAFGHTPGHMALAIESGEDRLLHVSDVALSPVHLEHPTWTPLYDVDPEQAIATKREIFDRVAAENLLVFAHHFPPFPALGHVVKDGDRWQWRPVAES